MSLINTSLVESLSHALDLTSLRQRLVTENLANVDTPGYRTRDIDFRLELQRALRGDEGGRLSPVVRSVANLEERPDGNNVSIDRESLSSARMDHQKSVLLAEAIESAFQQMGALPPPSNHRPAGAAQPVFASEASAGASRSRTSPRVGAQEVAYKKQNFEALRKQLEAALAPEIRRQEVALRIDSDELIVSLREIGFFDSGSANVKPGAVSALARVAEILQALDCDIRIEGHTDPVPIHTAQFASNWELSTARATGLVKVLIEKYEMRPERLSAAGFAEFHPVASNATTQGQQFNRRVDLVIVPAKIRRESISADAIAADSPLLGAPSRPGGARLAAATPATEPPLNVR